MLYEKTKKKILKNTLFYKVGQRTREYQDTLIKPKGSLGVLEDISIRLALMTGELKYKIVNKEVIIMCGDHGIADYGVSAYPKEVTKQMACAYLRGGAGASVFARANGAGLSVIDIGIEGDVKYPGLKIRKIREGTRDFTQGPAMTLEETIQAIEVGISETEIVINNGAHIIAPGEMGIGNTTASSALLAAFSGLVPEEAVGRGSLINDTTLKRKINIIRKGLEINKPDINKPLEVLAKMGGLEIAGIVGIIMACAANRIPVVIDGFIASVAALTAKFIAPGCERFMFASHISAEKPHIKTLEILGLKALLDLRMRLGEATGAVLAMQIIQTASMVICEMDSFETGGVTIADTKLELTLI